MNGAATSKTPGLIRCAIYTRKSSEGGARAEFNSLDAQRERRALRQQPAVRRVGLPARPLRRRRVHRRQHGAARPGSSSWPTSTPARSTAWLSTRSTAWSRSLLDFARIMEVFDRKKVSFVSVTQQFNTTTRWDA